MNDKNVLDDFVCGPACEELYDDVYDYENDIDLDEWSNW
jgi:hypothetical protein